MKLFEIKNRFSGNVIFSLKCKSFKGCIEKLIKIGANLRYADLRGANLSDANLKGADLRDANLSDANLRYADLSDASLSDASLSDANLKGANLSDASLSDANLRYADLRGANLRGASLSDANLRYADLRGANLSDASLKGADLRDADLRDANLDFSCWPLWCGSFNIKADNRLVAQLIHHIAKLNVENCSGGVKESIEHIRNMAISDLFCEYRDDIERIKK